MSETKFIPQPSSSVELMHLSDDILLDIFDRFDIESLCTIAGTCHHLQAIARKSFQNRKIDTLHMQVFSAKTPNQYTALTPAIFLQVVRHFGSFLRKVVIGYIGDFCRHSAVYKALPIYCVGTLTELDVMSVAPYPLFDDSRAIELFAHLTKLKLNMVSFVQEQHLYSNCPELRELRVIDSSAGMEMCLASNYPKLQKILLQYSYHRDVSLDGFQAFCTRHRDQLVDVHFDCGEQRFDPHAIDLTGLQRLTVRHFYSPIPWVRAQRWISLRIIDGKSNSHFAECLKNDSSLVDTLEELSLGYTWHQVQHWPLFATIKNLRLLYIQLELGADAVPFDELAVALEGFLNVTQAPAIKTIDIQAKLSARFRKETFRRCAAICKQRSIELTIHGRYQFGNDESQDDALKYFSRHEDEWSKEKHVYADLGKME